MTYTPIERGSSDWDVPVNAAFTSQDTRITTNETDISTINNTLTNKVSKSGDSLSGAYTLNNGSGVALTATANGVNNLIEFRDNTNAIRSRIGLNGNIVADGAAYFVSGIQMGSTSTDFGSGSGGVIGVDNATAAPTTNPTNGVVIYSEGGVLKVRQASGAVVNLGTLTTVDWQPSDHGLIGWTQDPAGVNTDGAASTSGVVYLSRINVRYATTISNLVCTVAQTAGSGLTAGQNWIGLYNSAGSKLAEVNMDTDFTSIGTKTKAITPQAVPAGHVYLALLSNGTTPPRFLYGNGTSASALNVNILPSGGAPRFVDFGTGQTALPSSVTLTSSNTNAAARWGAIF